MKGKMKANDYGLAVVLIAMWLVFFPSIVMAVIPIITFVGVICLGIYVYYKWITWHIKTKREDAIRLKNKRRREK